MTNAAHASSSAFDRGGWLSCSGSSRAQSGIPASWSRTCIPAARAAAMVRSRYSKLIGPPSTGCMVRNEEVVEITVAPAAWARPTRVLTSLALRIGAASSPVADCTLRSIAGPGWAAVGSQVGTGVPGSRSPSAVTVPGASALPRWRVQSPTPPTTRTSAAATATWVAARPLSERCRPIDWGRGERHFRPPNARRSQGRPSAISTPIATNHPMHSPRAPPMIPPDIAPMISISSAVPVSRVASENWRCERHSTTRWSLITIQSPAGTNNARIAQE